MTKERIVMLASRIKEADTWTDELLNDLCELADFAGIEHDSNSEPYDICIAVQDALGIDLGE